ncbi:unnamed protein product (macronuclear) [Paramecium tetraurelia]|uniref:Uncharacterized protein n=1 Tax=Paramecium tetraurelia TaxID=5888 RepID=A0E0X3_PARTE|nr:uncharacterized protein GSPATT00022108001 [Paramecium tetraurelia]CAK88940.1 unnamed protein product [Paramecium tetraurelia]|eukprot:XP_001456337.1 hypothetical protein (macronuclear) [Paramecium tetraurelia strain d4-2]
MISIQNQVKKRMKKYKRHFLLNIQIDIYNAFANEETEKLNQKENEDHPFVEVETETQPEEMPDELDNQLSGLREGLEGIDFSLFFDEYAKPNELVVNPEPEQQLDQELIQNKKPQQKYEEPKEFKQPKEKIEDVMKDLQITNDITSSEDEKILISQLKQKSAELKQKLQDQYEIVPKLEQAKKQTEVSIHPIDEQYPKIESDSKIDYEVESKYMEWSMSQDQKIKKIGLDLTEDDLRNPRFSLLQMDQKSELDIQKQINDFLGLDDISFVMIKQNLRRR